MNKNTKLATLVLSLLVLLAGCAQNSSFSSDDSTTTQAQADADQKALQDAEPEGAPIPEDSPFAKINKGMADETVRRILGSPDEITRYKTGKSWIPFAGRWLNDTRRQSWFYKNMGIIVFTKNNYSGQYKVLRIDYNATQGLP